MTGELRVEAEGETVGEAKWVALRELERRVPGIDRTAVQLQVVSEGERGLLGVGAQPAKVIAVASAEAVAAAAGGSSQAAAALRAHLPVESDTAAAAQLRLLLEPADLRNDLGNRFVHQGHSGIVRRDCNQRMPPEWMT